MDSPGRRGYPYAPIPCRIMITLRPLLPGELDWANARYADIGFAPSTADDFVLVAEIDDTPAGLGRLVPVTPTIGELGGITVFPEYRSQGIARALVGGLLARSPYPTLYCIPFARLLDFYGSFGFVPVADPAAAPAAVTSKVGWCRDTYPDDVGLLVRTAS